jgi:glycosyltransferase involved in cell wall biosynthesis
MPAYEKIEELDVYRFKMLFNPLNNPICPGFFKIFKKLKNFDIIHVHNEHAFVTFITCLINIYAKKPIVLSCHGQLRFDDYWRDLFERLYFRTIGKFIFGRTIKIITLSNSDKNYISSIGINSEKIIVIPNAINLEYLNSFHCNRNISKKQDEKIILFVGVLIKRKGIDYLIKSIPYVIKEHRLHCIIIGKGIYREKLETLVNKLNLSGSISFKGSVTIEELFNYYTLSDLFVIPSISEGLPTTILEAMYFGLPVIATDIPGIHDHFSNSAVLVPPKNEKELAKAIINVLNNKPLRENLSEKGKELVKEKYTWDKVTKSYLKLYHEILENKNKIGGEL